MFKESFLPLCYNYVFQARDLRRFFMRGILLCTTNSLVEKSFGGLECEKFEVSSWILANQITSCVGSSALLDCYNISGFVFMTELAVFKHFEYQVRSC